eukprot:6865981-Alexandrium_andersonii.AAC.1
MSKKRHAQIRMPALAALALPFDLALPLARGMVNSTCALQGHDVHMDPNTPMAGPGWHES